MNPYEELPSRAFWKPGVSVPESITQLWYPKFGIGPEDPIATAGSCFAQNIGRALKARNMNWLVTEAPPKSLPRSLHTAHGYGLFSFRTGNIYTPILLRQWVHWAFSPDAISDEVWQDGDRFFDPFRPSVHPVGFDTAKAVMESRRETAMAVRDAILRAKIFLFTPGLTETWVNTKTKMIYPACPGTVHGRFDPDTHRCINFGFQAGKKALADAFAVMKEHNPDLKLLLTVSPVPVTATVTGQHVLAASTYTKSVLRAIVGELAAEQEDVDYFPSFDVVSAAMLNQPVFNDNRRTIAPAGVELVMQHFFEGIGQIEKQLAVPTGDLVCEDEMLAYYEKG